MTKEADFTRRIQSCLSSAGGDAEWDRQEAYRKGFETGGRIERERADWLEEERERLQAIVSSAGGEGTAEALRKIVERIEWGNQIRGGAGYLTEALEEAKAALHGASLTPPKAATETESEPDYPDMEENGWDEPLEEALREILTGGQGDDGGAQIMPDFEDGQSVRSMVHACIALLETRRDVIEGYANTEAQLRHRLATLSSAAPEGRTETASEREKIEAAITADYENDLRDMTDEQIASAISDAQDAIEEHEPWLEALVTRQTQRARAALAQEPAR